MCVYCDLYSQYKHQRESPSENQRACVHLMLDPSGLKCWAQLVMASSLIVMTFKVWCGMTFASSHWTNTLCWNQPNPAYLPLFGVLFSGSAEVLCDTCRKHKWKNLTISYMPVFRGMAQSHVCSRLGREIKACQDKPGHGGGVGTGRDGMNKRQVQTKSGLLGLSPISSKVVGASKDARNRVEKNGWGVGEKTQIHYVYIGFDPHHQPLSKICSAFFSFHLHLQFSHYEMDPLIIESCWCSKLLTSQERLLSSIINTILV